MRITILLLFLAISCTPKMAAPLTVERVAQIFSSSIIMQDGKNFDVKSGAHEFTLVHNGQGDYLVYEKITDQRFGEHYEPTQLAKSYESKINEKRK